MTENMTTAEEKSNNKVSLELFLFHAKKMIKYKAETVNENLKNRL